MLKGFWNCAKLQVPRASFVCDSTGTVLVFAGPQIVLLCSSPQQCRVTTVYSVFWTGLRTSGVLLERSLGM